MKGKSVEVPPVGPQSNLAKANTATEYALDAFVTEAVRSGLLPANTIHALMYLPDQAVTRQLQEAFRAVVKCLGATIE